MGTCYLGICHDCKQFIDLDKFYGWNAYQGADNSTIEKTELEDYKTDGWIYRAMRLHIFLYTHNGHRVGVYSEHETDRDGLQEQYPWPVGLKSLVERIDMVPSIDRLIINTPFGEIIIDKRGKDINCFRFINGKRVDTVLLGSGV